MHTPLLANRLSRWLVVALLALLSSSTAWAQSTANYAFATSSTGTLVDMSSGTTDALATGTYRDDVASAVQNIGFTFVFMGTPYTQFSVNSNGQMRLGATAVSGTNATPASSTALLAPMGGDNALQATGRVVYKVLPGTNRTLVVEWTGLRVPYAGDPAAGTPTQVQVVLEENTGKIEYRYGTAYNNGTGVTRAIFISAGTSAGQIGAVKTFNTTPTYDATVTSATATTLADNAAMGVLSSTADGSRTVFSFTPTVIPAAPTVALTAVTQTSLTVSITDNSTNEYTFSVLRSTDNVTFTSVGTVATSSSSGTGSTVTLAQSGLVANTTYYYKVAANGEGYQSFALTATVTTPAATPICGTKTVGPGADYASLTTAFTAITNNGLCGPLVLELQAAYVSTVETFPLVYNYAGATATNTVTVRPAAGANNLSITGTTAVAVFNIVGGKYLIIDGRPGGSGTTVSGAAQATDLTISSTSTSGIPLQFTSDATFNTVQHVQVKGVGTSDSGSPDINFTGTVTTTGNSDNTVQYCNIGDGATTPVTLIYGGNALNARNSILNNNLFNNYGTGSTYGIYLNQSGAGWTISGNSFYQTASRVNVSGTMYGIFINANNGHTVSGNFIGGSAPALGGTPLTVTLTSANAAAAYRFIGIGLATTTGTATNVQGNAIGNITWVSSSGATTGNGILAGIYVSSGDVNIGTTTGNTVGGPTAPISVSTTTTGGYSFGISSASSGAVNISGNTISNITGVGAVAVASNVAGILASTGSPTISRNKIYNLAGGSAASGTVATLSTGIWLTGGTTTTVTNNLIGDLRAATSTSLVGVSGIVVSGGTTHNVYYNTLYLNATSTGTTFGTSGIYLNSTSATLDARNNIVVNKSTAVGTGGYTAALRRISGTTGTAPANLASTTNNNLYFAGTPSATNLIYVEGTTTATNASQTLTAYKALVATRESNSVTEDVPFASTTGTATNFLHISTTTPTQVEGGGLPITGITTDFDGETRNATTPDLGADEGTFTPQDLSGPTITYTALGNTPSTANRTLVVTITDPSGIATGTNAPRLYFRKGTTGAYAFVNATSVSGSSYTFTFDYSLIGGVAGFDVVQYYVAAQDVPGNASTSPLGGSGATPPGTTAPTAPNQFLVQGALAGTYYVGTSTSPDPTRTYATLTAAVAAYNANTLGGAVTFALLDAAYSTAETFPITLNANPDASATNTLTIKPLVAATVSGSNTTSLVVLNGANYVTLDGAIGTATTQDLTLANAGAGGAVVQVRSLGTALGATNVTLKNLSLTASSTTSGIGIAAGGATAGASGADNDNLVIQNNRITQAYVGIYVGGSAATSAGGTDGLVVSNNVVGPATAGTANIGNAGVFIANAVSPVVSGNTVQNVVAATASALTIGMTFSTGVSGATVTGNTINGVTVNAGSYDAVGLNLGTNFLNGVVDRNRVLNVVSNTSTYGGRGIDLNTGSATSNVRLSNNFVAGINGAGWSSFSSDAIVGIRIGASSTTGGVTVAHNSVNLTGNYNNTSSTSAYVSAALYVASTSTAMTVVDNILVNSLLLPTSTTTKNYAFYSAAANTAYTSIDYNDYFVSGSQGILGYLGADKTTLADLRTATGQDVNSKNVDPQFNSATDLHTFSAALNNAGVAVSGITVDIDGETRSTTTPDIGADEYTPAPIDVAVTALVAPAATGCYGASQAVTVTISNNATAVLNLALNPVTVTVVVTPPGGTTQTLTTTLNTGTLAAGATQNVTLPGTLNMTAAGVYSFAITTTTTGDGNPANNSLTATRTAVAPLPLPYAENFNASTNLPAGYTVDTGNATYDFKVLANHGTSGSNALSADVYGTNPSSFAILPKLGNTTTATNQLTFDARFVDFSGYPATGTTLAAGDTLKVLLSTDCGLTYQKVFAINASNYNGNGTASNSFYTYTVPLTGVGVGQAVQLQFVALRGNGDYYVDIDNINVRSLSPIDLAPVALVTPTATQGCYGAAETVTVQVTNQGSAALDFAANAATVTAVVTTPGGPQTLTGTVSTGSLAVGASQTVTLAPSLNMSAVGSYSFAITATVTGDQNTANDVLAAVTRTVAAPVAGTVSPSSSSLCVSGTVALTLTGAANGTIQWQQSTDNTTFTDVSGATAATFTTPVLTQTTYYRAQVRCAAQPAATSNVATITVTNPVIATTNTPLTICSGATATLTATATTGNSVRFFSTATGGTALTSTTAGSYTTPALTANTTYYAEAYTGGTENVGPTAQSSTGLTPQTGGALYFTTTKALTISAVTVFLNAGQAAGTVTIALRTGSSTTGAVVNNQSVAFAVPAGPATGTASYVVPLNYSVPAAGQYTLHLSAATQSGLLRDDAGANPSGYPYTSPSGSLTITGPSVATYYYYFYNWQIGSECVAATRTPIQVNVTAPATASFPAATATTCAASAYTLAGTVGGSATTGTYTSSGTGTFSPNATTLGATYTPSAADIAAGSVTITLTSNAVGTCSPGTATLTLTISPARVATFSYATATGCVGSAGTVSPTLGTGATAGTFSSTAGLTINATTGVITLATSTAGTYTVTNTVAATSTCPAVTATTTFTVNPRPATPTITATYNGTTTTLTSSAATGNQWYLTVGSTTTAVAGATGQTLVLTGLPNQLGSYTVTTTNANGCVSLPSAALVVTGTKNSIAGASLKLYPNPTPNGEVTLELTGFRSATQLTVLDPLGRVILTEVLPANAGTATHPLNLKGMASGVYLLRLSNTDGVETRRLVKE
ncbi:T9SS type A sorting domain-containing protein [Hymenobacter sp. 5317J-9]|uniref:beta strand repeat-containing protein n=1 Tax=Hymenobacter sp. 5317J-9 TaxID=2932250 RepID=UPI001FD69431|nr:T9SS type A sorting domain-containing protein [Hymenobacter sp. 5317J-9]UOQ97899.1 T9SS type A sorting domain-containing protein [Hymenobacter sp. 5317J-9]